MAAAMAMQSLMAKAFEIDIISRGSRADIATLPVNFWPVMRKSCAAHAMAAAMAMAMQALMAAAFEIDIISRGSRAEIATLPVMRTVPSDRWQWKVSKQQPRGQ